MQLLNKTLSDEKELNGIQSISFLILSATRAEEDCSQEEYSINARLVCLEALAHVHNVLSIIGKMGTNRTVIPKQEKVRRLREKG